MKSKTFVWFVVSLTTAVLTIPRENSAQVIILENRTQGTREATAQRRLGGSGFGPSIGLPGEIFEPTAPGWAPGTFGPPTAPVTMQIIDRSANNITLTWRNIPSNADSNILERREGDGAWQAVAELGVLSEWQTYRDGVGVLPDRLYCYRVRVRNAFGSAVTPFDKGACGYTRDGNNLTLGRAQLRIRVADVPNGGTRDAVRVRLNSPPGIFSPSGNSTWLDYGPDYSFAVPRVLIADDFDRGREFTYDLNLTSVTELSDITIISIDKEGADDLAIAELALIVNGVVAFTKFFGETSSTAKWIDSDSPYTIFHPELRSHDSWPTDFPPPALQIPNQELVDRLEAIIGDQIHGTDLQWGQLDGSDWVEIRRVNGSTLHVTVDLVEDIFGPNLEVNIEFDLNVRIVCAGTTATLTLATSNFNSNVNFNVLHDIVSIGIVEFFDDNIERAIAAAWQNISRSFQFTTGGLCPVVEVDQAGNLNFRLR